MPTFPGGTYSPIGAVSRSTDRLDIFAVANDGNVWTAAWEPGFDSWRGWLVHDRGRLLPARRSRLRRFPQH